MSYIFDNDSRVPKQERICYAKTERRIGEIYCKYSSDAARWKDSNVPDEWANRWQWGREHFGKYDVPNEFVRTVLIVPREEKHATDSRTYLTSDPMFTDIMLNKYSDCFAVNQNHTLTCNTANLSMTIKHEIFHMFIALRIKCRRNAGANI